MISMSNKKHIIINVSVIAAVIIGYVIVTMWTTQPRLATFSFESSGSQSSLQPLNGEKTAPITLKELRGQALLINFWASWCEACDAERASLEELSAATKGSGVKMIGIASSDTRAAVEKSGKLKFKNFPQYLEESGNLALASGVETLPQTLLIDRQGNIINHIKTALGPREVEVLHKQIEALNGGVGVLGEVPEFSLQSSSGQTVSRRDLHNKIWVVDFIFTSCPDLCPTMTTKMRDLDREFKKDDRFRLVSITVDPKNDTPEVLRRYQEKFGVQDSNWYFLTGKFGAIKHLIGGGFKLGTPESPELHTGKFVLVDGSAQIRGYYDSTAEGSIDKLKTDIKRVLSEQL